MRRCIADDWVQMPRETETERQGRARERESMRWWWAEPQQTERDTKCRWNTIDETSYSSCEWRLIISMGMQPFVRRLIALCVCVCMKSTLGVFSLGLVRRLNHRQKAVNSTITFSAWSLQCAVTIYMRSNSIGRKASAKHRDALRSLIVQPICDCLLSWTNRQMLSAAFSSHTHPKLSNFLRFLRRIHVDVRASADEQRASERKEKKNIFSANPALPFTVRRRRLSRATGSKTEQMLWFIRIYLFRQWRPSLCWKVSRTEAAAAAEKKKIENICRKTARQKTNAWFISN